MCGAGRPVVYFQNFVLEVKQNNYSRRVVHNQLSMALAIEWIQYLHDGSEDVEDERPESLQNTQSSIGQTWLDTFAARVRSDPAFTECNVLNAALSEYLDDSPQLSQFLLDIHKSKDHCDVVLLSSNNSRHLVHRIVLSVHSEYFNALLSERWKGERTGDDSQSQLSVKMSEFDERTMSHIIDYFYTGQVDHMLNETDLVPCLLAASKLIIGELSGVLGQELTESLQVSNALEMFVLADRLALKPLKVKSLHLLIRHYNSLAENSGRELDQLLTGVERCSIGILNAFYRRAQDRGVTMDESLSRISELLAITSESVQQMEERFLEAKQLNDEDIERCELALQQCGSGLFRALRSNAHTVHSERLERLHKTRMALQRQEQHIAAQWAFYRKQKEAYETLSALAESEKVSGRDLPPHSEEVKFDSFHL